MRFSVLIFALALVLALCCAAYMTLGAKGPWSFVLPFRGGKLASLIVVAVAVSTSTVLFQTVSGNRILTPSIVGFDALYVLILTGLVYFAGAQAYLDLGEATLFTINTGLMMVGALVLFGTLILRARGDVLLMVLTGIVCAGMFRALTQFWQRIIDPNEYQVIQVSSYARFNRIETDLLPIAAAVTGATLVVIWTRRHRFDVLALGYDAATNLGLNVRQETFATLALVAVLVSVTTAFVGPVVFLGLLVVSLARLISPVEAHGPLLLQAALLSAITLVGGQMLLERVFRLSTPLAVVIDLVGGALFLWLVLRGPRR